MLCVIALLSGCVDSNPAAPDAPLQFKLPKLLREVSGLAHAGGNKVLAVGDEQALVFEIDAAAGEVLDRFEVGEPMLRDDFEGIALLGDVLFLVTSTGVLVKYEGTNPPDLFDTGLASQCEVEGLAADEDAGELLILCKDPLDGALKKQLTIFAWNGQSLRQKLNVAFAEIEKKTGLKRVHPSGLTLLNDQRLFIVCAREESYLIVDSESAEVLAGGRFPHRDKHPQTEGVTVLADGRLVLADEGAKRRGRLSLYPGVFK